MKGKMAAILAGAMLVMTGAILSASAAVSESSSQPLIGGQEHIEGTRRVGYGGCRDNRVMETPHGKPIKCPG